MEIHGFIELARLRHAMGNDTGAEEILQRMSRLGPQHTHCTEALETLFNIKRSPADINVRVKAEAWTKKYAPDPSFPFALGIGPYHCDVEYFCNLIWARVQIAPGHFQEASTFIIPALQSAREMRLYFRVTELLLAQGLLQSGQGNLSAALEDLQNALAIAETRGYTRFFDDGPELDRLLQLAEEKNIHASYVRKLWASFHSGSGNRKATETASKAAKGQAGLIDPLSEREIEVLRLLALGLTLAEVAERLVLSPNTLKAHAQNIYSKLDVHSRVEAANKARDLGLI